MLIRLCGVSKRFRTEEIETAALTDIDLEIAAGDFVGVMGRSGCGKSTLLNILGLLDPPSGGEYWFDQHEVSRYSETRLAKLRRGRIGFIFQSFNLIPELNVWRNVELPLMHLDLPRAERRERVFDALDQAGLGARTRHFPDQLSGGQQQRVAFARAVVARPPLILADEPTGNLDTKNGEAIMRMLIALNAGGTTVVMVTHSASQAARAHKVLTMSDGRIVANRLTAHRVRAGVSAGTRAGSIAGASSGANAGALPH